MQLKKANTIHAIPHISRLSRKDIAPARVYFCNKNPTAKLRKEGIKKAFISDNSL